MLRLVILRLLESYFRHRWLYLLPIVVMIGLATYFGLNLDYKYQTEGVLYVQNESYLASLTAVRASDASWYLTAAQIASGEINDLLKTDSFVRAIIQGTDLEEGMTKGETAVYETIQETRNSIWVFSTGNNQVSIGASHEDPKIAYQLVNALIDVYLRWQVNAEQAENETANSFFIDVIDLYNSELAVAREDMVRYVEAHPRPLRGDRPETEQMEIARLEAAIDLAASRVASALDKEENTRLAMAQIESDTRQRNFLIDAPDIPQDPELSLRKIALQAGAFVGAGVFLTIAAIIGAAILDRSFRFPIDVKNRLDLSVLSTLPDTAPHYKWYQFRKKRAAQTEESELLKPGDPIEAALSSAGTAVEPTGAIAVKSKVRSSTPQVTS
jgi:capsular polysaccharide biosynthesis protein